MTAYSGICYDGPYEGEMLTHYRPYYTVAIMSEFSLRTPPPPMQAIDHKWGEYLWSRSLRKWVFRLY
jgi:hypothetical protein